MRLPHACLFAGIATFVASPALRAQDIVIIPCNGTPVGDTYCYTDNDEHAWHWQSECGAPVILQFTSGTIESSLYDQLRIFDGPDDVSVGVWLNGSAPEDEDLTGLSFVGSSGDLYMKIISNATNCCATDGFRDTGWEWVWSLSSGAVGIHEQQAGSFTMYPNPATSELHLRLQSPASGPAEVRILDMTGRVVYQNSFAATRAELNVFDLHGLQSGNYSVVLTTSHWVKTRKLQVIR